MSVISALSVELLQSYPAPSIVHSLSVPGQFIHNASENIEDIRVRQIKTKKNTIQQFSVKKNNKIELITDDKAERDSTN